MKHLKKGGKMEASEEKHELPHWSVWLLIVLGFLVGGYVVSLMNNSSKGRQDNMEQLKPPEKNEVRKREAEKKEIENRKTEVLQKVKALKKKEEELTKINKRYEKRVERGKEEIEFLQKQSNESCVSVDSMSALELYDFFSKFSNAKNHK